MNISNIYNNKNINKLIYLQVVGVLMSASMRTSDKLQKSTRPVKKWKVLLKPRITNS